MVSGRADLVGELAGERAQVLRVLVQARQQRGEAACHVAQFIARLGLREAGSQGRCVSAPTRLAWRSRDRRSASQAAKANIAVTTTSACDQGEVEHAGEGAIAQPDPAISALRDVELADHDLVVTVEDRRARLDGLPLARAGP